MKHTIFGLLCLCLLSTLSARETVPSPFQFDIHGYHVSGSKCKSDPYKDKNLSATFANANLMYTQYLNRQGDGFFGELGVSHLNIHWEDNPDVATRDFETLNITGGYFTTKVQDWLLIASGQVAVDLSAWDFTNHARYRGLMQGRYQYSQDLDLYVGILFYTNLQKDDVYPILGFEYQEEKQPWKIKIVIPTESHILYFLNAEWTVGLEHRFIQERHRLKDNEGLNKQSQPRRGRGIFDFRSQGFELSLRYSPIEGSYAKLFAGAMLPSKYRTYDKDGQNKRSYDFKTGYYVGFGASFTF